MNSRLYSIRNFLTSYCTGLADLSRSAFGLLTVHTILQSIKRTIELFSLLNQYVILCHSHLCYLYLLEFRLLYRPKPRTSGSLPWDHPKSRVSSEGRQKTLFDQCYLSMTLDEAQGFRNCGPKHSAARLILEQSIVCLILTATPLQTSTRVST